MYKALGTTHSRLGGDAGTQGVEIGGSKIQIHTHLHSEFKACFLHESLTHKKKLKKVKVVILSYIHSWRPVCSIPDIVSKQGRKQK